MNQGKQKGISRREFLKRCFVVLATLLTNAGAGLWIVSGKKTFGAISNIGEKPARYYKTLAG